MERMGKTKGYSYFMRKSIRMEPIMLQWLENTRFRVRESTYVKYRNLVQGHILPELGEVRVNRLTTERVEQFVRQQLVSGKLDGQGGLSEKTVRDMLTVLKEICRYAAQCDIEIPCHFEVIRIRKNDSEIRVLNRFEQMKLEQFLTSDESLIKTGILLSLYMGLRIGEVCALKRQHILYDEEILQVRSTMQRIQDVDRGKRKTKIIETEPKSSCSVRDIPIPEFLLPRLDVVRNVPEEAYLLTGSPDSFIEPRTMENIFKRCLTECRMETINYHALRHTFATRCVENGFDIKTLSEILGHASVNITLNRYVHSSMDQKRRSMRMLQGMAVKENVH